MRRILDLGRFREQFDRLKLEVVPGVPELVLSDVVVPCLVLSVEGAVQGGGLLRFERVSFVGVAPGVFTVLTVPAGREWAISRMSFRRLAGDRHAVISVSGAMGADIPISIRTTEWESPDLRGLALGAGMRITLTVEAGAVASDFAVSVLFREAMV